VYFNRISVLEGYFGHFESKGKLVIMVRIIFDVSTENHYLVSYWRVVVIYFITGKRSLLLLY